ncbi:MAG: hydroxyacid dehydrogenase [Firmicutes bacterium]|nr:hydroxyacid dehydrogenase [Bacillota bacterium]
MNEKDDEISSSRGEILFYQTQDGKTRVECRFEDETIWLSQG